MSSSKRTLPAGLCCALCAAAATGCFHSPLLARTTGGADRRPLSGHTTGGADRRQPVSGAAGGGLVASALLAAAVDEAPDEIVEFYQHEGEFLPRPSPWFPGGAPPEEVIGPESPASRSNRFGVRYGLLAPGEADYDWPEAWYLGLFLRRIPRGPRRMTAELGGEFVKLEAPGGFVFTRMYVFHADLLLGLVKPKMGSRGLTAYGLVGGQLITEEADVYYSRDVGANGFGLEIGGGVGFVAGGWILETRAVYTEIMSSGRNTEDTFTVSFGVAF